MERSRKRAPDLAGRVCSSDEGVHVGKHLLDSAAHPIRGDFVSQTAAISSISQNADIRFLGKLLGDVIRAYGGDALFQRIEVLIVGTDGGIGNGFDLSNIIIERSRIVNVHGLIRTEGREYLEGHIVFRHHPDMVFE